MKTLKNDPLQVDFLLLNNHTQDNKMANVNEKYNTVLLTETGVRHYFWCFGVLARSEGLSEKRHIDRMLEKEDMCLHQQQDKRAKGWWRLRSKMSHTHQIKTNLALCTDQSSIPGQ